MRTTKYVGLLARILSPLAESVGSSFEVETVHPGDSPAQLAYAFVGVGADLLIDSAQVERVPSLDKRTRKRVAKAVAGAVAKPEAGLAAAFLAQAFAADLRLFFEARGDTDSAAEERAVQELVQEHFPIPGEMRQRLDGLEEDPVLKAGEFGVQPEDPTRYASSCLHLNARVTAIEIAVGPEVFGSVRDRMVYPGLLGPPGWDAFTIGALEDSLWGARLGRWKEIIQRQR